MPKSRRFTQLERRLDTLRSHFLLRFSAIGDYSNREQDLARAYLILAHAEIEAFCEDRARAVAVKAQDLWNRKGRCSKVLVRLINFHNIESRRPWKRIDKSHEKVNAAIQSFMSSIDSNNGVREENLLRMFFPIGIELADLDNTWLATMDSFGKARGKVAHTTIKAQQQIDPATEYGRVTTQIIPGLKKLDRKMRGL